MAELTESKLALGSCEAGGWYDAYTDVSAANLHNNLLFELEDLAHSNVVEPSPHEHSATASARFEEPVSTTTGYSSPANDMVTTYS